MNGATTSMSPNTQEAAEFARLQFAQPAFRAFCRSAPLADVYALEIARLGAPQTV